jgi:hypothetical protein
MSDTPDDDDLRDHYDFDYRQAKPNRFAAMFGPLKPGGRVVYLEPEVAERFPTSEDVNRVLKALLDTMPKRTNEVIDDAKK